MKWWHSFLVVAVNYPNSPQNLFSGGIASFKVKMLQWQTAEMAEGTGVTLTCWEAQYKVFVTCNNFYKFSVAAGQD